MFGSPACCPRSSPCWLRHFCLSRAHFTTLGWEAISHRRAFGWFFALIAFGGAHILGVSPLADDKPTRGRKILRFANCAAYLILFAPAFYAAIALVVAAVGTALDYEPERPPPSLDEQSVLFQALAYWRCSQSSRRR